MARWKFRSIHEEFSLDECYAIEPSLVTFRVHYNGVFSKPPGRRYEKGSVTFVDGIDCDAFCIHDLDDIMAELGYLGHNDMWYHFLKPGTDLDNGLMDLGCDDDVRLLLNHAPQNRLLDIFIQHGFDSLKIFFDAISPKARGKAKVVIEEIDEPNSLEILDVRRQPKLPVRRPSALMWHEQGSGSGGMDEPETVELPTNEQPEVEGLHEQVPEDSEELIDPNFLHEEMEINMDGYNETVEQQNVPVRDEEVEEEGEDVGVDEGEEVGDEDNEGLGDEEGVPAGDPLPFSDMESNSDSDFEASRNREVRRIRRQHEREVVPDMVNFYTGQEFGDKEVVKELINKLAIQCRRQICLVKNDKHRVRAVCKGQKLIFADQNPSLEESNMSKEGCPWALLVSCTKNENTWRVKTYVDYHTCFQTREVKLCTQGFLAKQLLETLATNPNMPVKAVQHVLQSKFQLQVSKWQSFRAKKLALKKLRGDYRDQYADLRAYILELQRTNANTTVKLDVHVPPDHSESTRQFKRVYICLGALKSGFKACHRELLGLDGAFMKGPYPGQVLTAVGVDPNNGIYPLAYAVVEAETKDSWTWFLENLGGDLELTPRSNFTFVSDRQKGIIPALAEVFPNAEHRFCLRHIHENMRKCWSGKVYKEHLWKCATATTISQFEKAMDGLKNYNKDAHKWLKEIHPSHWARSHFSGRSHCEVLLNNMCEVFNRQLVDARDKPIISCLEYIRQYLMRRIVLQQRVIEKSCGPLTPTGTKIFEAIKKEAAEYIVTWNGGKKYEVLGSWQDQCVVDMETKLCTCRRWEISGVLCKHAVAAMWYSASNGDPVGVPESWVHRCYWLRTWKEVYSFKVDPLQGRSFWPTSNCPTTITPPPHHIPVGRPPKKRKRSIDEVSVPLVRGHKIRRIGKTVVCSKCKQRGHNSRMCTT